MSVLIRNSKWHYRFCSQGKIYSGACLNCETQKQAEKYEADIRAKVNEIKAHKTVQSLIEDYRQELVGGEPIPMMGASKLALKKPSKKIPTIEHINQVNRYWRDFAKFMEAKHPDVQNLSQVRKVHCEEYVAHLVNVGRFDPTVSRPFKKARNLNGRRSMKTKQPKAELAPANYTFKDNLLAPKTVKTIASVVKWVFNVLAEDAGVTRNPMNGVVLPAGTQVPREIFTEEELARIREGIKDDPFCHPLFTIAALTGLTEGDICTLKWDEIDQGMSVIRRKRRKTGVWLEIPLTRELEAYIFSKPRVSEFIFPDLAFMYLNNRTGVSERIKKFLDRLGIENVKKIEGRRAVSVKDLHSMRHVFCFYAGQAGIPITTVQSIVGHLTPEMTRHYSRHDTIQSKQRAMEKLPMILSLTDSGNDEAKARAKLSELAYTLPLDKVQELLKELG